MNEQKDEEEKVPLVNNDDLNNNINGNQFGFGVPDAPVQMDINDFEEEIDVKKAYRYEKGQKFEDGVEKEFQRMKNGEIPGVFADDNDDDEFFNFSKMPNSLDEFQMLRAVIARRIFGEIPDKILDNINRFMMNLFHLKKASEENFFPGLVVNILYWPLYIVLMLFNCLKESIMWWFIFGIIFLIFTAFIGLLCGLLFVAYRGMKIYLQRYDWETGEAKSNKEEGDEQMEGGAREQPQSSNGSQSAQFEGGQQSCESLDEEKDQAHNVINIDKLSSSSNDANSISSLYEMDLNVTIEIEEQKNYTNASPRNELETTPNSAKSVGSDIEMYGPITDICSLTDDLSSSKFNHSNQRKAEKRNGFRQRNLDQVY